MSLLAITYARRARSDLAKTERGQRDHTYAYTYYPAGWLETSADGGAQTAHYVYDSNGQPALDDTTEWWQRGGKAGRPVASDRRAAAHGRAGGNNGGGFGNPPPIATYDDQRVMTSYGANNYSYTSNGELTDKFDASSSPVKHTKYVYDALGNLKYLALPGGKIITLSMARTGDVWRMATE